MGERGEFVEHKKVARDLVNGCLSGAIGIYLT